MKNPPNPGHHVPLTYLEPLPLSVTEAARRLGITRQTLNNVFNKKSAISPEIALRFEKIEMGYGGRLNDARLTNEVQFLYDRELQWEQNIITSI